MDSNLYKKAYFLSRRGLQELDHIFIPYVKERFPFLNKKEKNLFLSLLKNDDVNLLEWLINETPPPKELIKIVNKIKEHLKDEKK